MIFKQRSLRTAVQFRGLFCLLFHTPPYKPPKFPNNKSEKAHGCAPSFYEAAFGGRTEITMENDSVKLLRECDAGVKMGVKSIHDVIDHVSSSELKSMLHACKDRHDELDKELQVLLGKYGDEGKKPSLMAEAMSKIKTEMKLGMKDTDNTVADLMTDGCNMGVKSLSRYLNQYAAADEKSKSITKRLISLEAQLAVDMRPYL